MDALRAQYPHIEMVDAPDSEMLARLDAVWAPHPTGDWKKGEPSRNLNVEEHQFILREIVHCKADVRYWLHHYAWIKDKDGRSVRPYPLLDSQEMMLTLMGETEDAIFSGKRRDGILITALKCRQVGISTATELLILHRTIFYGNLNALIAADVEEQSANLFDMTERCLRAVPWWMRPKITNHVKDSELTFGDIDSLIHVTYANSTRGGSQIGFEKGQLGRGWTVHLFHGSEMSTWQNPGQVDDALDPAIPKSENTFGVLESTARGRGWWYNTWLSSRAGENRWLPLFIPWYTEARYREIPPSGWVPLEETVRHAVYAEEVSAQWCKRRVNLDREQLYFWEKKYLLAKKDHKLFKFLAEYSADDETCFRVSDDGFFDGEAMLSLRQKARPPIGLLSLT